MPNNLVSRSGWFTPRKESLESSGQEDRLDQKPVLYVLKQNPPPTPKNKIKNKNPGGGISPDCNLWFVCSVQYSLICDKSVTT